ncbi:MAG: lysophospholipid acyltransferase family protein [Oleiphilus sp.]
MKAIIEGFGVRSKQAFRFGRLGANLLAGSAFISSCYRFPSISKIDQYHLGDYRLFAAWVKDLTYSMNTELLVTGKVMSESGFFVSNHISWLDTIILSHIQPISFIARHDLEHWPLLGTFTKRMQSVYIDRTNKFQAYRSIPALEARLNEGRSVHVFPEATTSEGSHVLTFYPMFYEAAVRTGKKVQAVAIQYCDEHGQRIKEPAFINDDSFLDTLERILRVKKVYAHYHFCEPLDAKKNNRKQLCALTKRQIEDVLSNSPLVNQR